MNELLKKVKLGLSCCVQMTEEDEDFGCRMCPYNGDCGDANDDVALRACIIEDIRSLLKAMTPRVMTLEEVKEWSTQAIDKIEPVYIENIHDSESIYAYIGCFGANIGDYGAEDPFAGYGSTWRCWTYRPTEEQRRKTEWQQ